MIMVDYGGRAHPHKSWGCHWCRLVCRQGSTTRTVSMVWHTPCTSQRLPSMLYICSQQTRLELEARYPYQTSVQAKH